MRLPGTTRHYMRPVRVASSLGSRINDWLEEAPLHRKLTVVSVPCSALFLGWLVSNHSPVTEAAAQLAERPEHLSPSAWALALVISSVGKVAAIGILLSYFAREHAKRLSRIETSVRTLRERQQLLQAFATSVLYKLNDSSLIDEQFVTWFRTQSILQEVALQELLPEEKENGSMMSGYISIDWDIDKTPLHSALRRLGLSCADMFSTPKNNVVNFPSNEKDKKSVGGANSMFKERAMLERLAMDISKNEPRQHHEMLESTLREDRERLRALYELEVSTEEEEDDQK